MLGSCLTFRLTSCPMEFFSSPYPPRLLERMRALRGGGWTIRASVFLREMPVNRQLDETERRVVKLRPFEIWTPQLEMQTEKME